MDRTMREYIAELNQNYNDLGEDLLMLEAVLYAPEGETGFPEEYMESGLLRIQEYARVHIEDIGRIVRFLTASRVQQPAPTSRG